MRRFVMLLLCVSFAAVFTGCSTGTTEELKIGAEDDEFVYEQTEATTKFDVLSDGTVCAVTLSAPSPSELQLISLTGEITGTIQPELFQIYTITAADDLIYVSGMSDSGMCVYEIDPKSGEQRLVGELTGSEPTSSCYAEDKLFFTCVEPVETPCPYDSDLSWSYDGTVVYSLDPKDGTVEKTDVDFPSAIAASPAGKLIIYAADENGLYFTEGTDGKKQYSNLGTITAISGTDENGGFVFCSNSIIDTLNYSGVGENGAYSEIIPQVSTLQNGVKYRGGFTFFINTQNGQRIERIRNSAFIKKSNTIRIISPSYIAENPFGCGYSIKSEQLTADEFALSVLSLDSNYDLCMLSSKEEVSENLRNKGTYYPLNDIPGIQEYLDRCFPYVRETATADNGEIWMLPIALNINAIMYNEASCAELGIDFSSPLTVEKYRENIDIAYSSEKRTGYDSHAYLINTNFIMQLLRGNSGFDTPDFRSRAEYLKENFNYIKGEDCFKPIGSAINFSLEEYGFGDPDDFLFSMRDYSKDQLYYSAGKNMRISPMPSVTDDGRSIAVCTYLCVNPTSNNLEAACEYIEALIQHLNGDNSSVLFADSFPQDNTAQKDLYGIYSNAAIEFNIPFEVFRTDYERYLADEITLDEFISEAERKMKVYQNE